MAKGSEGWRLVFAGTQRSESDTTVTIMRQPFSIHLCQPHRVCCRALLASLLWSVGALGANRPKFSPTIRLQREPETQDASKVQEWDIGLLSDLTMNLFGKPGDPAPNVRAQNINTIDEVPDSNWFTNRIYARAVTIDEVARGPLIGLGPAPGTWTIIRPKRPASRRASRCATQTARRGSCRSTRAAYPVAATGAMLVANKIFWALGYWQVENHLVTHPSREHRHRRHGDGQAAVRQAAPDGEERSRRRLAARASAAPTASYRAVAARAVPGRPVGGFSYYGTRPDDPNDVVPHEHRRELRALQSVRRVDEPRGHESRQHARHASSPKTAAASSATTCRTSARRSAPARSRPREGDEGHEYLYEGDKVCRSGCSRLGLYLQPWQTARLRRRTPRSAGSKATGSSPTSGKPRVPVAALRHARPDDTFWAALRVMAFTDAHIPRSREDRHYTDPAGGETARRQCWSSGATRSARLTRR